MDKLDVILWVLSGGFAVSFGLMLVLWNRLNSRMDRIEDRIDKIDGRLDKLDEKMTDIDRRLCRLEGALSAKECCVIKEDKRRVQGEAL